MPSTIIDSTVFQGIFATDAMRHVWSDENRTTCYLDIEAALAKVQGELGIIPAEAAADIIGHCRLEEIDLARLREQTERIGYPILGVVTQVNQLCRDGLGEYVHWGATTQDITDTATVLQIRAALELVDADLTALSAGLAKLAKEHRDTPMIGRSNLQQAIPITFGYKMAGLLSAVERHRERLHQLRERVLVGEFAGAAGTLASLPTGAMETQAGLCAELGLAQPVIAWHTIRDNIAEVGAFLGLVGGTLGKLETDVKLMMQTEVGEVYEPYAHGRGSSSTMPQKRNPISSCYIHAAISVVRQHAAALMDAMVADHERSTGPWEIEWIVLPEAFCLMAGALRQARTIVDGLEVDADAMRRNIDLTGGLVMSEAVMMGLGPHLGREYAHDLVYDLCRESVTTHRPLLDLLAEHPEIKAHLDRDALAALCDPANYLGQAGLMVDRVLAKRVEMAPGPGSVVPCVLMRAGTSRGPFFLREWLPADDRARDEALVGAIGASDELGLDGVGGGSTLTSKVAIVSRSDRADCDVDYLFAQVGVGRRSVDTTPNCGNMLAGVGPFAIEQGLVPADDPVTTVRIHNVNTGARIDATVQTPGARVDYAGDTRIDGVAGTAAPIRLDFLDAWGAVTGAVFPTGRRIDVIEVDGIGGVEVTCIDAAMPLMVVRARDLGVDGRAAPEQLDADATLRTRLESLRRTAGRLMGLGDVADRVVPKPVLVSAGDDDRPGPRRSVTSRYFTPHRCHTSHAATGAIGVATAFALPGTVADGAAGDHTGLPAGEHDVAVLHPQGRIDVTVQVDGTGAAASVTRAALVRTARKIFQGELHLPGYVFSTGVLSTGALSTGAHSTAPAATATAAAGPFPQRPLRLVVPTAAGGANDALARTVARRLGPLLGQTVVVDNRSGAGGSIACEHVAHAAPDGHTLLLGYVATHAMNPALQPVGYDPVADFTPVGLVGTSPTVLVTAAGSPFTTVAELVARLAAGPGGLRYASAGNGTAPHFAAELFALHAAPDTPGALRGVPHEGSAAALNATVTGRAEVMFASLAAAVAWIASGALRALAVAGPHRAPALPDVPTLREAGVDGVDVAQWYGLFAPAATPGPVVDRLTAALDAVLTDAAAVRRLADLGVTTGPGTADHLGALVRHELARWSAVVRDAGLRPDRGRVHRLLGV